MRTVSARRNPAASLSAMQFRIQNPPPPSQWASPASRACRCWWVGVGRVGGRGRRGMPSPIVSIVCCRSAITYCSNSSLCAQCKHPCLANTRLPGRISLVLVCSQDTGPVGGRIPGGDDRSCYLLSAPNCIHVRPIDGSDRERFRQGTTLMADLAVLSGFT